MLGAPLRDRNSIFGNKVLVRLRSVITAGSLHGS